MKKNNKKGFTLAELLVVVAIIAVLTAIAIPVFSAATTKAKEAADMANLRTAYAEAVTSHLTEGEEYPATYDTTKFPALNASEGMAAGQYSWSSNAGGLSVYYSPTKANNGSNWSITAAD